MKKLLLLIPLTLLLASCQSKTEEVALLIDDEPAPTEVVVEEDALFADDPAPAEVLEEIENESSGRSAEEKVEAAVSRLHDRYSGDWVLNAFDDLEVVHAWDGPVGSEYKKIFPFTHYYSPEADTTFMICAVDKTVAVCDGLIDETLVKDVAREKCDVHGAYGDFIPESV